MMELTSKDLLRLLRVPLEDFTNEVVKKVMQNTGNKGMLATHDDGETLVVNTSIGSYGVVSIGMTAEPLLPSVTIMVNNAIFKELGHEFTGLFSYGSTSFSRDCEVRVIRLGVEALNWQPPTEAYHPLRKYRGPVGSAH